MLHPPSLSRRTLIRAAGAVPLLALPGVLRAADIHVSDLKDITTGAQPIGPGER